MTLTLPNQDTLPSQTELSRFEPSGDDYPRDYAELVLDENGNVSVQIGTLGAENECMLEDQYHRRTLKWSLPNGICRDALADTLVEGGPIATLLARVVAGHKVEWDGSNMRGSLDCGASDAYDAI